MRTWTSRPSTPRGRPGALDAFDGGRWCRVSEYIRIGAKDGDVAVSGSLPTDPALENGFRVPTVLEVPHTAVVAREEIFGPLMPDSTLTLR